MTDRDEGSPPAGRPPRVGINLLWLVPGVVGGSERAAVETLRAVARMDEPGVEVHLFALGEFVEAYPDLALRFPTRTPSLSGRLRPLRVLVESTWLRAAMPSAAVDLVHHWGGTVPVGWPRGSLLTVHDIQPLLHPENFSPVKRAWLGRRIPASVSGAREVVVPSSAVGHDLVAHLGADERRIEVIPWGVDAVVPPPTPGSPPLAGPGGRPYVLYPAIPYVHKNHRVLIEAVALAPSGPDLVFCGGRGPCDPELEELAAIRGVTPRVHRLGRVDDARLAELYRGAAAVAVPSEFEGFGLPVLEAMAAGVPVIVSNLGVFDEVAPPTALRVDPGDAQGWATALQRATGDASWRRSCGAEGLARSARFGWSVTARAHVRLWRELTGSALPAGEGGRQG